MQYKGNATKKRTAAIGRFMRALHTYSAMWVLILLVFFSITGITLNHPTWQSKLGAQQSLTVLALPDAFQAWPAAAEQADYAAELASWLQQQGVKAVSWQPRFEDDEQTLELSFKRPAGYAVALVDFSSAEIELEQQFSGYLALANDLHKGRDAGLLWKWLIDITAIACLLFAITGFYLLLKMPSKKSVGNALAVIGGMMAILAYLISLH
ncbi:PepSY-associated TM helix domain-containing protein [Alishewanella longhuensis]